MSLNPFRLGVYPGQKRSRTEEDLVRVVSSLKGGGLRTRLTIYPADILDYFFLFMPGPVYVWWMPIGDGATSSVSVVHFENPFVP